MSADRGSLSSAEQWWPEGLTEYIGVMARDDELFAALDKGLRSFGWPDYNIPRPLPLEDTWPGLALALAQRIRELDEELGRCGG